MSNQGLTLRQKNSLIAEMIMQEKPSEDKVFTLLNQLQTEKSFLLESMVKGDAEVKATIKPQLETVKDQLKDTEEYIELLINKQDN